MKEKIAIVNHNDYDLRIRYSKCVMDETCHRKGGQAYVYNKEEFLSKRIFIHLDFFDDSIADCTNSIFKNFFWNFTVAILSHINGQ